jgi:hypothetical protein
MFWEILIFEHSCSLIHFNSLFYIIRLNFETKNLELVFWMSIIDKKKKENKLVSEYCKLKLSTISTI